MILGVPSLELLYQIEEKSHWVLTVKVVGNQWYWTYNYTNIDNIEYDSFIKPRRDLIEGEKRLLEVDNATVIPYNSNIIIITTSNDVIHSWAIPSLNVKYDANPGRINRFIITANIPGVYYGQCSEICGANHAFIPIKLEVSTPLIFKNWLLRL